MKTVILGAGVTGLSAGIKTGATIYEALDKPGGICRSYYMDGFRFENGGGHWIFGSGSAFDFMDKYCKSKRYDRKASVYFNQFIPYPIQTYFNQEEPVSVGSLKSWLRDKFGAQLSNLFFYPFNKKYTAGIYDQIVQADPAKSPAAQTPGYNSKFSYPINGLDKMVDEMANGQDIRYGKKAIAVDGKNKTVTFKDGEVVKYDQLISTIPLKELLKMMKKYQGDLPHTSVMVLNIGARVGKNMPKDHWIYISNPETPFFRVQVYSNVDQSFAPEGHVSLCVERSFKEDARLPDEHDYNTYVASTLQDWGWIGAVKVLDVNFIKYAYTWLRSDSTHKQQIEYLDSCFDIKSIGRFGSWKFQGIAESIIDGLGV